MAENAPQKSATERMQERMRFGLAVIGRKALSFAQERGFQSWDEFEKFLGEAFPAGDKAPAAPAPPGPPEGDAASKTPPGGPDPDPAKGPKPAGKPDPPPRFDKAARELMEANGVDEQLLVTFLGGQGSGPSGRVAAADVERYLNG
jgi:pyruvate/2-oxoglutarate dehydrogenase complex dihydrolipoamide acyltransferase (E2) component